MKIEGNFIYFNLVQGDRVAKTLTFRFISEKPKKAEKIPQNLPPSSSSTLTLGDFWYVIPYIKKKLLKKESKLLDFFPSICLIWLGY